VKEFIHKCKKNEKDLLELGEMCEFIETTFEITYRYAWINIIMKKCLNIFIINVVVCF
jgi:transposase